MRVICVSRHGFSVLVYHNVTNIAWDATNNRYTITHATSGTSATTNVSNADYFIQVMGFTPVSTESSSGSSGSEVDNSGGSGT